MKYKSKIKHLMTQAGADADLNKNKEQYDNNDNRFHKYEPRGLLRNS